MTQLNAQALMAMPYEQMVACIKSWNRNKMEESHSWRFWRRDDQFEPQGDWRTWLVMAGRGYGKTRMRAEWVSALATQYPGARLFFGSIFCAGACVWFADRLDGCRLRSHHCGDSLSHWPDGNSGGTRPW